MITLLSPAKKLSIECNAMGYTQTQCAFLDQSRKLVNILKKFGPIDLQNLMGISENLSLLNLKRFKSWRLPFSTESARQAIFSFMGDTYVGLDAGTFTNNDLQFAQENTLLSERVSDFPFHQSASYCITQLYFSDSMLRSFSISS